MCPDRLARHSPVDSLHTRTVWSALPVASRSSFSLTQSTLWDGTQEHGHLILTKLYPLMVIKLQIHTIVSMGPEPGAGAWCWAHDKMVTQSLQTYMYVYMHVLTMQHTMHVPQYVHMTLYIHVHVDEYKQRNYTSD